MNFYTPLYLNQDFDQDGLDDLITIHGGDPIRKPRILISQLTIHFIPYRCCYLDEKVRLAGEVLLISAKTGRLLNVSLVPDGMESYYSPQLLKRSTDEEYILVGTGGETHGGGLYALNLNCFREFCSEPVRIIDFPKWKVWRWNVWMFSIRKLSVINTKVWWLRLSWLMSMMIKSKILSFHFIIPLCMRSMDGRLNRCGIEHFQVRKLTGREYEQRSWRNALQRCLVHRRWDILMMMIYRILSFIIKQDPAILYIIVLRY